MVSDESVRRRLLIIDTETGTIVRSFTDIPAAVVSPDGKLLLDNYLTADEETDVFKIISLDTGNILSVFQLSDYLLWSIHPCAITDKVGTAGAWV